MPDRTTKNIPNFVGALILTHVHVSELGRGST